MRFNEPAVLIERDIIVLGGLLQLFMSQCHKYAAKNSHLCRRRVGWQKKTLSISFK